MSWYWNEIGDKYSAQYATTTAVWISYLIAVTIGLIGFLSLAYRKPILGLDGWALLGAGLFVVVGWQIGRLSRAWAVIGFSVYVLGSLINIGMRLAAGKFGLPIMETLFAVVYLNALRGTFAYHKYLKLEAAQPHGVRVRYVRRQKAHKVRELTWRGDQTFRFRVLCHKHNFPVRDF
ncbi:MAG: hypothetical protein ABSA54_21015 [Terriglobales bacterium]|jgi:hypothetical protein